MTAAVRRAPLANGVAVRLCDCTHTQRRHAGGAHEKHCMAQVDGEPCSCLKFTDTGEQAEAPQHPLRDGIPPAVAARSEDSAAAAAIADIAADYARRQVARTSPPLPEGLRRDRPPDAVPAPRPVAAVVPAPRPVAAVVTMPPAKPASDTPHGPTDVDPTAIVKVSRNGRKYSADALRRMSEATERRWARERAAKAGQQTAPAAEPPDSPPAPAATVEAAAQDVVKTDHVSSTPVSTPVDEPARRPAPVWAEPYVEPKLDEHGIYDRPVFIPEPTRGHDRVDPRRAKLAALLEQLTAKPGQWAILARDPKRGTIDTLRRWITKGTFGQGFQVRGQRSGEAFSLYACYQPE